MTDEPDLLELRVVTPRPGRRRRLRRGLGLAGAVAAAAGVTIVMVGGDDPDRTAIDRHPPPTRTEPVAPVAPAPAPGRGGQSVAGPTPGQPEAGAVLEEIALRPDGGVGPFAEGTPRDDVLAMAIGVLGEPDRLAEPEATQDDCTGAPTGTTTQDATWNDLMLTFAGPRPDELQLVGWQAVSRPGAPRRFRLADGPVLDDPLTAWRAAYGPAVEVHERRAGDAGQSNVTIHLPDGDVTIAGRSAASGHAVVARGGALCSGPVNG
jgi:hypothetical protein